MKELTVRPTTDPAPNKQSLPYLIALIALVGLVILGFLLWGERSKRFPLIGTGEYLGTIEGVFSDSALTSFYAQRRPKSDRLFIVILRSGWRPQLVDMSAVSQDSTGKSFITPLIFSAPEGKLRFIGEQTRPYTFSGSVSNLDTGSSGSWKLALLDPSQEALLKGEVALQVKMWLQLKADLEGIEKKINSSEQTVPQQRAEIEKLSAYLAEGDELKSRAQEKYDAASVILSSEKTKLKSKHSVAQELTEQIDLSERVTAMGRLVSLARQSLARENRWFESMLKTSHGYITPELEKELARSEHVMNLKRQIAFTKDRIFRRLHELEGGRVHQPSSLKPQVETENWQDY